MTEEEWLECTAPLKMLAFVQEKASDRKLLFFACACLRRFWQFGRRRDPERMIVYALERFADQRIDRNKLERSVRRMSARELANLISENGASDFVRFGLLVAKDEQREQTVLLRDLFRNPFRLLSVHPNWLTPIVTNLASSVYEERVLPSGELDASRLAILADALEDTGCDNQEILEHLRSPGPHVRGCWCVDLLLVGKE